MWRKAKLWLAITLAALSGCATGPLGGRMIASHQRVVAIDVRPIQNDLVFLWEHTDSVEWLACAQGHMSNDTLKIDALELTPDMSNWSPEHVWGSCRNTKQFVGTIHPHKGDQYPLEWRCQASDVDMNSFLSNDEAVYLFIECDEGVLWVNTAKLPLVPIDSPPLDTIQGE